MLLVHWSKQRNTSDILKNGIKPTRRKSETEKNAVKGVWCYPFSRDKFLNNNWKRNLKTWRKEYTNYNGFVFKLEEEDFPIYAGDFFLTRGYLECTKFETKKDFIEAYGRFFSPKGDELEDGIDYQDFEIIIPNKIRKKRIIKILKDRKTNKNSHQNYHNAQPPITPTSDV